MLFFYFLKNFYRNFFALLVLLLIVLGAADILLRMSSLPATIFLPHIFFYMIPLIGILATPLAASLAVQLVVGKLYVSDALLLFRFLPGARKRLHYAVLVFSCSIVPGYIPLVFDWAPKSYLSAKKRMLSFAKEQVLSYGPGKFHFPAPNIMIFFKEKTPIKEHKGNGVRFKNLLFMLHDSHSFSVITAWHGTMVDSTLALRDGMIETRHEGKPYKASFSRAEIDIETLIHEKSIDDCSPLDHNVQTKFLSWQQVAEYKDKNKKVRVEYLMRIMRSIWLFLFPFLGLAGLIIWGRPGHYNLLLSIGITSLLLFVSYASIASAQVFWRKALLSSSLMLVAMLMILGIVSVLYQARW